MVRHIHLQPHLTTSELGVYFRHTRDPIERSRWQFLWLLSQSFTAKSIAAATSYSDDWFGRIGSPSATRGQQIPCSFLHAKLAVLPSVVDAIEVHRGEAPYMLIWPYWGILASGGW